MPRYVRFTFLGKHRWGIADDSGVTPLAGTPYEGTPAATSEQLPWDVIALLPPATPTKIIAIGRNYAAHAAELGNAVPERPLMFLKPPSCVIAHQDAIVYPSVESKLVHHEGELAVVIGRRCKNVAASEAGDVIFGYTLMNDVTARDLQRLDVQFTRGKGFDTFGPCGPWVDTDFSPSDQQLRVEVNGEVRQQASLDTMIFDVPTLVAYVSRVMTLEPGDLISTGTPSGVGPLVPGDSVSVTVAGLGTLTNSVVSDGRAR